MKTIELAPGESIRIKTAEQEIIVRCGEGEPIEGFLSIEPASDFRYFAGDAGGQYSEIHGTVSVCEGR